MIFKLIFVTIIYNNLNIDQFNIKKIFFYKLINWLI